MMINSSTLKLIGPGLLYAGAAVGVSHLVQSTRAGAQFGYELIWVIIVAHLVKYPFFLMGPMYAKTNNKSILHGYKHVGKWAVYGFIALTIASMFAVIAAISVVTAGLAENLFHISFNIKHWTSIVIGLCALVLVFGKYSTLDKVIKYVILLLSITTVFAFGASIGVTGENLNEPPFNFNETKHLLFLVAFIGWMPAPMDISIWHSVWQVEKQKKLEPTGTPPSYFDFNLGFVGTGILALLFLSLGANVFFGKSIELASSGVAFSGQLVNMYSSLIGSWAFVIIAIAAFTTMFSTVITCLDAFPRSVAESLKIVGVKNQHSSYLVVLTTLVLGSQIIIYFFMQNMKQMVDFATTLSFVTTPILAALNYMAMKSSNHALPKHLTVWSILSLILLFGFAGYYVWFTFYS
jgi:Mn2+/Fe2+ NRAMP family transporter